MAMIHVSRSGATLGVYEEAKVREGLLSGEFIGTDLGWMEGMATWRPLSELDTFQTPTHAPPPVEPTLSPQVYPSTSAADAPAAVRTGLPWDNRRTQSFFNALFDTLVMVLTRPMHAFNVMSREGGLFDPLLYALIGGSVGAIVSMGFSMIMPSFGALGAGENGIGALLAMGGTSLVLVILMPIFVVIGTFILAGIFHLSLMLLGGANQPFETTFRVVAYAAGSANWLQIIPVCGSFFAGIYTLVLECIGLARAHETDTWRAVVAVLLPAALCCGLVFFSIFFVVGMVASSH